MGISAVLFQTEIVNYENKRWEISDKPNDNGEPGSLGDSQDGRESALLMQSQKMEASMLRGLNGSVI